MAVATVKPRTRSSTVAAPTFTGTRSGNVYTLGQQIGAGGNGVVYTVARRPELVAKIQKQVLSTHDIDKLDVLVRAATPDLLSVAAWPIDCLKSRTGQMVGFLMPRIVDARPLYELYSPRARVQHFPSADFRFLVHAAANVARLFAAVHKAGFIAGDVNHSNILVRANATVAAVDCDSFQVGDGSRFPCLVGTELFVPPELLGATLGATPRTASHDAFGLAVLIFHLLFMGRHPFAGRYLGKGDMPIERAIAESRFAYSRDTSRTRMAPPPYTPSMDAVGPAVTELFERAFHADARKSGRPGPEAWIDALGCPQGRARPLQDGAVALPFARHATVPVVCDRATYAHQAIRRHRQDRHRGHRRSGDAVGALPGPGRAGSATAAAEAVRVGQAAWLHRDHGRAGAAACSWLPRRSSPCSSPTCCGPSISRNHGARLRGSLPTTERSSPSSLPFGS